MQILGQAWTERTLIALAFSYEQATHRRIPATVADPALVGCHSGGHGAGGALVASSVAPATAGLPDTAADAGAAGASAAAALLGLGIRWIRRRRCNAGAFGAVNSEQRVTGG